MDNVVNLAILRNPWNWISIGAMIIVVLAAAYAIYIRLNSAGEDATPVNTAKEV